LSFGLSFTPLSHAQTGCVLDRWTEVPGGGITTGTGPATAVLGQNLHLFVTGGADQIFTNVFESASSSWRGWSEVPGSGRTGGSGPAAAVYRGNLHLFVLGPTGHIFVNTLTPAGWGTWSEVPGGGIGTEGLAAATFQRLGGSDELDLFVRSAEGTIFINTLTGPNWSGWSEVPGGGITTHGPAAIAFGNLYLYVRGTGGGIYENTRDLSTGNWGGWREVPGGGLTTAAPGVAASHTAGILLAVRGLGSGIHRNLLGPGSSQQWSELPGNGRAAATAGPAVVVYQSAFHLFVSGPDDRIICSLAR
jgi:hypothetical protein